VVQGQTGPGNVLKFQSVLFDSKDISDDFFGIIRFINNVGGARASVRAVDWQRTAGPASFWPLVCHLDNSRFFMEILDKSSPV
jgi:hypothetical protein